MAEPEELLRLSSVLGGTGGGVAEPEELQSSLLGLITSPVGSSEC